MDLRVEDFGCVPDGRFLPEVSIVEGSAVLIVDSGDVRPVNVGKHIAVPGAADLVATIAALLDRQEVRDAAMTAGSPVLSGTLFDPRPPSQDLTFRSEHVGTSHHPSPAQGTRPG